MNAIWSVICLICFVILLFTSPELALPSMLKATNSALSLSFELLAIYAIWLGILGIIEHTKISNFLAKLLSPLINWLWGKKKISKEAKKYLSLSLSTSVLGIGGASIPFGIKAIEKMDDKSGTITYPMIMTIVFASSGVQLLPTTAMGLMVSSGSTNPAFIILPTLLSGLVTTIVGVSLCVLCEKISIKRKQSKASSLKEFKPILGGNK